MTIHPPTPSQKELTAEQRAQLEAVATMNMPSLRAKYREVFGEETTSRNAVYLRKRIVWRIQEKALGGLSERAKQRLRELGQEAPFRYRGGPLEAFSAAADRLTATTTVVSTAPSQETGVRAEDGTTSPLHLDAMPTGPATEGRDPRLPPPGTLIKKDHRGLTHTVQVLPSGFLYNGIAYASLSKVARQIAGSNWNGFTFFGLTRPWSTESAA